MKIKNDDMKKAIIIKVLIGLVCVVFSFNARSQGINFGATRSGLHPGDTVMVPLRLTGTGVQQILIAFNYNQTVLFPQATLFSQVYAPSGGFAYTINPSFSAGVYYMLFSTNNGNAIPTMTNKLIGYFCFVYTGGTSGTTTLHLRQVSVDADPVCHFWDIYGGTIVIANYSTDFTISGTTGISPITLSSLATGGPFDWDDPTAWVPSSGPTGVLSPAPCFNVIVTGDEVDINGTTPNSSFG